MLILLFLPSFPASLHPFVAGQALSVCDSVWHPWSESDAVFPTLQWFHTCGQTAWRQRPHTLVSADACNIDFLKDSIVFIVSWMWVHDIFQPLNTAQSLPIPSLQDHCRQKFFHCIRHTSLSNKLIIVSPDDWEEHDKHAVPNSGCKTSRKAAASIMRSERIMSRWILVEEVVSVRDWWRWLRTVSSSVSNQNRHCRGTNPKTHDNCRVESVISIAPGVPPQRQWKLSSWPTVVLLNTVNTKYITAENWL